VTTSLAMQTTDIPPKPKFGGHECVSASNHSKVTEVRLNSEQGRLISQDAAFDVVIEMEFPSFCKWSQRVQLERPQRTPEFCPQAIAHPGRPIARDRSSSRGTPPAPHHRETPGIS